MRRPQRRAGSVKQLDDKLLHTKLDLVEEPLQLDVLLASVEDTVVVQYLP